MALFSEAERAFAQGVSQLVFCNPFVPQRRIYEREALGDEFVEAGNVWSVDPGRDREHPNAQRISLRVEELVPQLRKRIVEGRKPGEGESALYEDLLLWLLYHRFWQPLKELVARGATGPSAKRPAFYREFVRDADHFRNLPGLTLPANEPAPHLFACFFQIRRAFHHIFGNIVGASMPAARLRAAIWESIFTHDMRRYRRGLYRRMGDLTTLITGPSGTGKELVAGAIGMSRYIPFDPDAGFASDAAESFFPLNLSALSPTLIESELFGHHRGAFTGALADRAGWLETCPPLGTVFLDEIGELDSLIQVKLLRVLHSRTFQRLGETTGRRFEGKIIAATNRDLAAGMRGGTFRADFFYRLCADMIATPTLHEQLTAEPADLGKLLLFLSRRVVDDEAEAASLASEVEAWIRTHLGSGYAWPGNVRELEQCVRNVLIRKEYRPARAGSDGGARRELTDAVLAGALTADELLGRYCTLVYSQSGSYEEAARRLGLDRRTVRARVDEGLLKRLRGEE